MQVACLRRDLGASLGRVVSTALAVVLLLASAGPVAAETNVQRALDCNSELAFGTLMGIAPGATVPITVTVISGPSTDGGNLPVVQQFDKITFFPSCTTTLPCAVDPALPVSFVGLVSNTCGVMPLATPLGGGTEIEITFPPNPPSLTLPAAATPTGTTSCDLVFDVLIDASFVGSNDMEINTAGVCDPGMGGLNLNSSAQATARITTVPVPTLGEFGLVALALMLALGSWIALRRRPATG